VAESERFLTSPPTYSDASLAFGSPTTAGICDNFSETKSTNSP